MTESQRTRGPIGWADAIDAVAALQLQDDLPAVVELLRLLDLSLPIGGPNEPVEPPAVLPRAPVSSSEADLTSAQSSEDDIEVLEDVRTHVEVLSDEPFEIPRGDAEPLAEPPTTSPTVRYEPPVVETQLRAAVTAIAQHRCRSRRIDVAKSVDRIAQCLPLTPVPLLDELTTRAGMTVVADTSTPMMPYLADVDRLVNEVRHVVGSPSVAVSWLDDETFETDPSSQLHFESRRPVLIVSTLGARPIPGDTRAYRKFWAEFAWAAGKSGIDVVALVPHRLNVWPRALAETMRIVAWDDLADVGRGRG